MKTKEEILQQITGIADILNKNNINYIIGASCALLVHGLDVVPNDIDVVVGQNDLTKTKMLLTNFVYEVHTFPIHTDEVCFIDVDGINVRVNKLEAEYRYYLKRKGESEKVDNRIKQIEDKLKQRKVISEGGIVTRKNPNKQILLTIFTHIKGLGFPKGHVEEGETFEETAIREVTEETGLTELRIVKKLGVYSKIATERDGIPISKDIHMYLLETDKPDFHQEAEEKYDWFNIDDAVSQMVVDEDRNFLVKIKDEI